MLNAVECDPENDRGCPDNQVCDLRDKFCVIPAHVKKIGVVEKTIRGIRVLDKFEKEKKKSVSISPIVGVLQEMDEDTVFSPPPAVTLPTLPTIDIPPIKIPAAKMPKISSRMLKSISDTDFSNINQRIKASLGLTTL
jgi:hypothetical protein